MVSSTQFPHNPTSAKSKKLWNPSKTLGIINTDPGYQCITCIGHAPSKGRRCRNPIRSDNVNFITDTLDEIAYLHPDSPTVTARLRAIAGPALCVRYHQGQAESVVKQWQRSIKQLALKPQIGDQPVPPIRRKVKQNIVQEAEQTQTMQELQDQLREMRELLARIREERSSDIHQSQGSEGADEQAARQRRKAERKERQEREEREKEREARRLEKERLEKERLEKERLAKEKREREREESRRREREQAAQNERIRQRAQRIREEREREKREAKEREEKEWTEAWTSYRERWVEFRASMVRSGDGNLRDAIPWPVKSGSHRDVKASNVEKFLRAAVVRDANPPKLLRQECKKWHPDMIDRLLPGAQLTDVDRMMIDMICRVVTNLINDSAGKQSELFD